MDFNEITRYFVFVVIVACLVLGYIIKTSLDFINNKYIPLILALFGLVLNLFVSGMSIESAVYGSVMGLASTGFHQAFKRFVEGNNEE